MSSVWLKMIGTAESPCLLDYQMNYVDFTHTPKSVDIDDHLVLYAVGRRTRIFAIAKVKSKPYDSGHPRFPSRVDIEYETRINVKDAPRLETITDRSLLGAIMYGSSYLQLEAEELNRAREILGPIAGQSAE